MWRASSVQILCEVFACACVKQQFELQCFVVLGRPHGCAVLPTLTTPSGAIAWMRSRGIGRVSVWECRCVSGGSCPATDCGRLVSGCLRGDWALARDCRHVTIMLGLCDVVGWTHVRCMYAGECMWIRTSATQMHMHCTACSPRAEGSDELKTCDEMLFQVDSVQ